MSNVTKISGQKLQVIENDDYENNKDAIKRLGYFLEAAKRGEVEGVAIAAVMRDGSFQTAFNDCPVSILACLSRLVHRMNLMADVTAEDMEDELGKE